MNIWFDGGGFLCLWSLGVAEVLKSSNIKFNLCGGYSTGGGVAAYLLNNEVNGDEVFKSVITMPYGATKPMFSLIGKHEINLKHLAECVLCDPISFKLEKYNDKLYLQIRPLKRLKGSWRNNFRDYDDITECLISTQCIPYLASASCSICYYDNVGDVRGPTIDGAIFSKTFPKQWNKSDTLRISTWGSGDINLSGMGRVSDILFPNYDDLLRLRKLGNNQANEFLKTYKG